MKKLVIAEKPSVGREIARTLSLRERGNGYIEGDDYIVTWALGHLVELAEPSHYSERYKRWSLNDLPMLPEKLDERVIDETKDQFDVIKELLKRSDVSSVVIATDEAQCCQKQDAYMLCFHKFGSAIKILFYNLVYYSVSHILS